MFITHIIKYASPIWATLKSYLEDLLESIQRKALRIIFGKTEYADAMAMASFDTLKARRVVACQRFTLIVQQHPALMYVIPSLTFHECEYSLCSCNPRPEHGWTNGLNDFVTVKYQHKV